MRRDFGLRAINPFCGEGKPPAKEGRTSNARPLVLNVFGQNAAYLNKESRKGAYPSFSPPSKTTLPNPSTKRTMTEGVFSGTVFNNSAKTLFFLYLSSVVTPNCYF
jgi:hypothetical protein